MWGEGGGGAGLEFKLENNFSRPFIQVSVWSLKGQSDQDLVPVKNPTKVLVSMETA